MHSRPSDPMDAVRARLAEALAGRYVLEGQAGWGGMALVFRARDLRHTRSVAIKVMRPELVSTSVAPRFLDEIRMVARLQHPHIVPLYDSGEADGLVWFVMPFIDGETLRDRLDREGRLALPAALAVTRDVADAVGCAHDAGIVHRDIKPENILLAGGHALVTDFGVAVGLHHDRRGRTDPGLAVGTYAYMSPEQASTQNGVDGRADIYALACVLYEMLAGHTPWTDVQERLYGGASTREVPPIGRADVPERIEQALARSLAMRPADRFSAIGDFADALALSGVPRGVLRARRRFSPWLAAAASVAIGVTLAVGGFKTGHDRDVVAVAPCTGDTAGYGQSYCQWSMAEALGRWSEMRVVDPTVTVDAARQLGVPPNDVTEWPAVTREVGAGRFVRTELTRVRDTLYLSGRMHDEAGRVRGRTHRVVLEAGGRGRPDAFVVLAGLLTDLGDAARDPGILGSHSLEASRAYADGMAAFGAGRFVEARAAFATAAARDDAFGDALFMLAQVSAWLGAPLDEFRLAAERAALLAADLRGIQARQLALPLSLMARGDFAQACALYREVAARDTAAFAGWLGLADCLARDQGVLRSAASPSGYVFRASWHEAQRALEAALLREPGVTGPLWHRILRIMEVREFVLRVGRLDGTDSLMAALDDYRADTAYHVPYPFAALTGGAAPPPSHQQPYLLANRRRLAQLAERWVASYPREGRAYWARGDVRELVAVATGDAREFEAALADVTHAWELGFDSISVRAADVRLRFRLGRWNEVAEAARRIELRPGEDPVPAAGAATLGGRSNVAATFYEGGATATVASIDVERHRLRLDVFAGLRAPEDSVRATLNRLERAIERDPAGLLQPQLEFYRLLAVPTLGVEHRPAARPPITNAGHQLAALASGKLDSVRATIMGPGGTRENRGMRDVPPVMVWLDCHLLTLAGDTAVAIGDLDIFLGRIHRVSPMVFQHPADVAALVQAMRLRAELAWAVNDRPTAARWARVVLALWDFADPDVRASVSHLEAMAPGRR